MKPLGPLVASCRFVAEAGVADVSVPPISASTGYVKFRAPNWAQALING
jgi:hypothetical protein